MRSADRSESLELLLDILCNTLGSVIFIALLVIIIARSVTPGLADRTADALDAQIARLTAEKKALQTQIAAAHRQLAASGRPASFFQQKRLERQEAELARLRQQRSHLESRLAAAVPPPQFLIRPEFSGKTPTDREPVWLLVTRRHLFRAGRSADFAVAGRAESAFVGTERRTGEDGIGYWVLTPKRGWLCDTPEHLQTAVVQALSGYAPERHFLAVLVAPDAVADFWQLRGQFRQAGFRVAPRLTADGDFALREYTNHTYEVSR